MNHKEFNRLDAKDILTLLKGHPQADQTAEAAASLLGADVATAWTFRKKAGLVRLVDEQTGKYPTSFYANGQLYHIRSVKEGLGFVRYKEMKQMLSVVGFNATYSEQMQALERLIKAANSLVTKEPKLNDLFAEIENMRQAIKNTDSRKWDYSFYAASLFICRPDENMNEWSEALANEKIQDWHAEGLHEQDFFFLVILWGTQLSEWWRTLPGQIKAMAPDLYPAAT